MSEQTESKTMIFNDSREALDYLVNKAWNELTLEQRKFLRDAKRDFNHGTIRVERIDKFLLEFAEIEKKIVIKI